MTDWVSERKTAIHLLRAGHNAAEVARRLKRHPNWVRKWWRRYQAEGWGGLNDRSRAPHQHGRKISETVRQAICLARSELEAEAATEDGLKYVGAYAIRTRLQQRKITPLPSPATIERVLHACKMTRPYRKPKKVKIDYPHLKPTTPLQLCQVDIVPHFLEGGERVACFNAIDVVSRYPTGKAFSRRRAKDAAAFLIHVWQEIGIPRYTQLDNEGCFSGGTTHPYVLGKVVRLALSVGTEIVFSPVYHPESNGYVERFHQDYNRHVWQATYLADKQAVQEKSDRFFPRYRHSQHHSAQNGLSPHRQHHQIPLRKLRADFVLPSTKLPLHEGWVHFIRRVQADKTVSVLNVSWDVPRAEVDQGVWVTLSLAPHGATLHIYDAAPDVKSRQCLATHPFPLTEKVIPKPKPSRAKPISQLISLASRSVRHAHRIFHTIY